MPGDRLFVPVKEPEPGHPMVRPSQFGRISRSRYRPTRADA